jgi:hypothetical protein
MNSDFVDMLFANISDYGEAAPKVSALNLTYTNGNSTWFICYIVCPFLSHETRICPSSV